MLRNYFKMAWRNLVNNKMYAAINIVGLAIGLAVCMLIVLYVGHERSYDRFHKDADRICWIQGKIKIGADSIFMPKMSYATAPLAKVAEPRVESSLRLINNGPNTIIQNKQAPSLKFAEAGFQFADSNFFHFFSFPLLRGDAQQVLQNPFSVVLSETAAKKYFGNQDPVGKVLRYDNAYDFMVTGVAKNAPSNSSIPFDFVASLSSIGSIAGMKWSIERQSQGVQLGSFTTYFLLRNKSDAPRLEQRLHQLNQQHIKKAEATERYYATPLADTHLKANFGDASNVKYLNIFPFVAALILLLALTNYMSLSTARFTTRAKEIGVRKVMGARRSKIALQFFVESALYTVVAFALGYMLCLLLQPVFFNFLQIDIDKSFLYQPPILGSFSALLIITIVLAATYPALLLSAFKPVQVLYGKFSKQRGAVTVRKFFTVFQFTISIALIICGFIISRQLYFFRHADTGVARANVVMVPFASAIGKHYTAFQKEAAALSAVAQTATANYLLYKGYNTYFAKPAQATEDVTVPAYAVEASFISMLGLKWKTPPDDSFFYRKQNRIVVNEQAVQKLNLGDNPLHQKITFGSDTYEVAGVLKDFNYASLHQKIDALSLFITSVTDSTWAADGCCLFVKLKPHTNLPAVIGQLKTAYEKYDTDKPFEFHFLDDTFEAMYKAEDRLSKLFYFFIAFTLLIACLGLFGLTTFAAEQRTKEIGIRKVLGASVASIVSLLTKDFLKLVVVAIIIAAPVAWYFMHQWLNDFAYRTSISWWIFAAAGAIVLLVAWLTVSFQSVKAAMANPVKNLRTE